MVRLTNHLELLLAEHDCVVIPGVGGFVMKTLPPVYNKEEHSFSPMRREIIFNRELTHTDGLLVSSYARTYGKAFEEAQAMVEKDVAELEAILNQHGKVILGTIGVLTREAEGRLLFAPADADVFAMPALPKAEEEEEKEPVLPAEEEETALPPSPRKNRWWAYMLAGAAIGMGVAWYLTLPEKVQEEPAFAPVPVEVPVPVEIEPVEIEPVELVETVEAEAPVKEEEGIREAKKEPISVAKKAELEAKVEGDTQVKSEGDAKGAGIGEVKKGKYYVVIGSFPNEKRALSTLKVYRKSGGKEDAGILHRDGRYRVYAGNYASRDEAKAALTRIWREGRYKDAWLLIQK
ncbi:MAG: SPOR domain-containing protein [Tannerellaceae bacterium]|jgi:hypothetical protein|nr:SPOR domain-containing protein [Tannerellaceae bacterium]